MSLLFTINKHKQTKRKQLLRLGWIISVPHGMQTHLEAAGAHLCCPCEV